MGILRGIFECVEAGGEGESCYLLVIDLVVGTRSVSLGMGTNIGGLFSHACGGGGRGLIHVNNFHFFPGPYTFANFFHSTKILTGGIKKPHQEILSKISTLPNLISSRKDDFFSYKSPKTLFNRNIPSLSSPGVLTQRRTRFPLASFNHPPISPTTFP